jgi:hypothetical protein
LLAFLFLLSVLKKSNRIWFYSKGVAKEAVIVGKEAVKVGKVAAKGLDVAEKIANNPLVQTASSLLPGGGEIVMAESVFPSMCANLLNPDIYI